MYSPHTFTWSAPVKHLIASVVVGAFVLAFCARGGWSPSSAVAAGSHGVNSCTGANACQGNTGEIGDYSCNGNNACQFNTGYVGDNSCNGESACTYVGGYGTS